MRRTKIVCTIGPASDDVSILREMIVAGMDIARINFSHGTRPQQQERIARVRTMASELGRNVAILGDLSGPKLRTGTMAKEPVLLKAGDPFTLTSASVPGDWRSATVSFPGLSEAVKPGETILLNDGAIHLVVLSVTAGSVETRVQVGGLLGSHKGVNIPGRDLAIDAFTAKDQEDAGFAAEQGLDWLALSFVKHPDDLRTVRRWMAGKGSAIPLIAKIEKREAIDNLEGVLGEADGVMVARGDLGVEVALEEVPFLQKTIITRALALDMPVITATHMLESMITQPRPTRAEATDVATAVLDGADAMMLSEETASGRDPVEAVRIMARLAERAEREMDRSRFGTINRPAQGVSGAVAHAACTLADEVGAAAILVPTSSGKMPLRVASRRPSQPVIALADDPLVRRRLALAWGVTALPATAARKGQEMIRRCLDAARAGGYVKPGELVVVTSGYPLGQSGTTNSIDVVRVT